MRIRNEMNFVELEGVNEGGSVRFNLDYLLAYTEEELWLHGGLVFTITPGTAKAIDDLLEEMGHRRTRCEKGGFETTDVVTETTDDLEDGE